MRRLVRALVVALCCMVMSLPVLGQGEKGNKVGGQGTGKAQKKTAQTHVQSTQKGSAKKAKKGQTKNTQKQSAKETRSTKKGVGKSHSSQTKKGGQTKRRHTG